MPRVLFISDYLNNTVKDTPNRFESNRDLPLSKFTNEMSVFRPVDFSICYPIDYCRYRDCARCCYHFGFLR
jgi:hypothetical protein